MSDDETVTVAVLGERVKNLSEQVCGLQKDMKHLWWKLAFLAGTLSTAGAFVVNKFGG